MWLFVSEGPQSIHLGFKRGHSYMFLSFMVENVVMCNSAFESHTEQQIRLPLELLF